MNEENLHIDSIELAEDQSFISWVKYGLNDEKWTNWINDHPEQKEKVDEAKSLVQAFQFEESTLPINTEKLRNRIDRSIDAKVVEMDQSGTKVRRLYRRSFIGIAASIAVLLGVMFFLNDPTEVITPYGEAMVYTLPDGSKVNINAGSSIEYDKKAWDRNRELTLDGEAYFEVEKGSKFRVVTNNGTVQVLGTKFNVYSRGSSFQVKCTEGKVEVKTRGDSEILQAGDIVELRNGELEDLPFKAKFDWRQKAYEYKSAELSEVFGEIERQFNVKVEADESITTMTFTGPLETKDLKKALYMVTWPMNLDYKINGNSVEISKK